jgi:hypothetical protein
MLTINYFPQEISNLALFFPNDHEHTILSSNDPQIYILAQIIAQ